MSAVLVTAIDLETSAASACGIESSEIGLLPELGRRNCSYWSSHPERCCRLSALNTGSRGAAGRVTGIDSETSHASACRIRRSELGLILEL
eukprot:2243037-Pyramimonas_sp.AAC.1